MRSNGVSISNEASISLLLPCVVLTFYCIYYGFTLKFSFSKGCLIFDGASVDEIFCSLLSTYFNYFDKTLSSKLVLLSYLLF